MTSPPIIETSRQVVGAVSATVDARQLRRKSRDFHLRRHVMALGILSES